MFAFATYAKSAMKVGLAAALLLPAEAVLLAPQKADAYVVARRGAYGRATVVRRGPYGRTTVVHRGPYGRAAAVGEYRPYGPASAAGVARRTARRVTRRTLYALPAGYRTVYVGGSRYYVANGVYYRRTTINGRPAYVVRTP